MQLYLNIFAPKIIEIEDLVLTFCIFCITEGIRAERLVGFVMDLYVNSTAESREEVVEMFRRWKWGSRNKRNESESQ